MQTNKNAKTHVGSITEVISLDPGTISNVDDGQVNQVYSIRETSRQFPDLKREEPVDRT